MKVDWFKLAFFGHLFVLAIVFALLGLPSLAIVGVMLVEFVAVRLILAKRCFHDARTLSPDEFRARWQSKRSQRWVNRKLGIKTNF